MNVAGRFAVFFAALFASALLYMGADWQTEIAAINIANGWPFAWPLCFLWESNWAAFDFWRLIRYILVAGWVGFLIYYYVKSTLLSEKT